MLQTARAAKVTCSQVHEKHVLRITRVKEENAWKAWVFAAKPRNCPDGYEEISGGLCKKAGGRATTLDKTETPTAGFSLKTTLKDFRFLPLACHWLAIGLLRKESYDRGQGVRPDTPGVSEGLAFTVLRGVL